MSYPQISIRELDGIPPGTTQVDEAFLQSAQKNGWQLEAATMTLSYRQEWTAWQSFREMVQNALDATNTVTLEIDSSRPCTFIYDSGTGIPVEAMSMGERKGRVGDTAARDKECLRGRFGEGMKLAVLPVMRAGGRVFIRTVGFDVTWVNGVTRRLDKIIPAIVMMIRPNNVRQGTAVAIDGLDASDWNGIDLRNRVMQHVAAAHPHAIVHTVVGGPGENDDCKVRQLLFGPGFDGNLYVRDLWVNHLRDEGLKSLFGYNLWFEDATEALGADRDRLNYNPYTRKLQKEMWRIFDSAPKELLSQMLHTLMQLDDRESYIEWKVLDLALDYGMEEERGSGASAMHFFAAAVDAMGTKDFVWADSEADRKTVEHASLVNAQDKLPRGLKRLFEHHDLVKKPEEVRRAVLRMKRVPLTVRGMAKYLAHLVQSGRMDENDAKFALLNFRTLVNAVADATKALSPDTKTTGFYCVDIAQAEKDEASVAGFYDYEKEELAIRVGQIRGYTTLRRNSFDSVASEGRVMGTLIHELAHALSRQDDLTDEFEHALVDVGVQFASLSRSRPSIFQKLRSATHYLRHTTIDGGSKYLIADLDTNGYDFFLQNPEKPQRERRSAFDRFRLEIVSALKDADGDGVSTETMRAFLTLWEEETYRGASAQMLADETESVANTLSFAPGPVVARNRLYASLMATAKKLRRLKGDLKGWR